MGRKKPIVRRDDDSILVVTAAVAVSKSRKKAVMIDDDEYSTRIELSEEPQVVEEKVVIIGKKKGKKGSAKAWKHDEDEDEEDSKIEKEEDKLVETGFSGKPKKGRFGMSYFGLLGDEDDDNDEDEEEDLGKNKNKKAIARAETLSHHKTGGSDRKTPKSLKSILIQQSLAAQEARALYFASVEERETVDCFLADQGHQQHINVGPKNKRRSIKNNRLTQPCERRKKKEKKKKRKESRAFTLLFVLP
ncbi:uncharacterized protein LOC142606746 [Castanea sativa]|uniref:uncharacterized protein LOC142606746 n=1 Tax=Castanea sativa TaxID=21020 RepID=UPI003F65292B